MDNKINKLIADIEERIALKSGDRLFIKNIVNEAYIIGKEEVVNDITDNVKKSLGEWVMKDEDKNIVYFQEEPRIIKLEYRVGKTIILNELDDELTVIPHEIDRLRIGDEIHYRGIRYKTVVTEHLFKPEDQLYYRAELEEVRV